jgi:hypothetical protein
VPVQFQSSTQQLTVQHTSATIFASGSVHPVEISFADTGTPPTNQTFALSYQVPIYRTLTPSMARPAIAVDTNSAGFSVRVRQTRADAALNHNLARAEDQIRDRLKGSAAAISMRSLAALTNRSPAFPAMNSPARTPPSNSSVTSS